MIIEHLRGFIDSLDEPYVDPGFALIRFTSQLDEDGIHVEMWPCAYCNIEKEKIKLIPGEELRNGTYVEWIFHDDQTSLPNVMNVPRWTQEEIDAAKARVA